MNDRDMWWKIGLIGIVSALAIASVFPLEEKLKFGIDLRGGYSLLYEIDDTGVEGPDRATLAKRVMTVLRERVDPKGVYNLVWRPIGHNRIEIQMPQPSEEVTKSRRELESLQTKLRSTIIKRSDVIRAISSPPAQRPKEFADVAGEVHARMALLENAAKAHDEYMAVKKAYEEKKAEAQKTDVSEAEVRAAVQSPSGQRTEAFNALVRGKPHRTEILQAAAKAYDEYIAAGGKAETTTAPATKDEAAAVAEKRSAYNQAVNIVLATNEDVNKPGATGSATLDDVIRLEEVFEQAVSAVIDTNVDLAGFQLLISMKPGDPARAEGLKKFTERNPELKTHIDELLAANDRLHLGRSGEGRLEDPADLERLLKGAGVLEFRILPANEESNRTLEEYRERLRKRGPRPMPGEETYEWFEIEDPIDFIDRNARGKPGTFEAEFEARKSKMMHVVERYGDKYYVLAHIGENAAMTHRAGQGDWSLKTARPDRDESGRPAIHFELDQRGGSKFGELTRRNKGQQLCIFLDDKAISSARINAVITTRGIIEGSFTMQQVQDMVKKLNAGSLPRKLKEEPISVRAIGPSLGKANREAGLRSAEYGAICVILFMVIYYFYAGSIAVFAVALNTLLIAAMMALLGATLTLPGIAGLVLSVGMAVDANVLINERIREELHRGTAMRMAIKLGYERAFRAILDSNLTTMLTSVILYFLGSEEVKGFGLTLGVGVFINLFTAYFVTRIFFDFMVMPTIPAEVKRNPFKLGGILLAIGGLMYGLGYWMNHDEIARSNSVAMAFGRSLMFCLPAIVGTYLLMYGARAIHAAVQKGKAKPTLPMLELIGVPKINWVKTRGVWFTISIVLTIGGVAAFLSLKHEDLYDIEFLGGTSAQIDLKPSAKLDRNAIQDRLSKSADHLAQFSQSMANATITGSGGTFTINSPGVPAGRLEPVVKAVLADRLAQGNTVTYSDPGANQLTVLTNPDKPVEPAGLKKELVERLKESSEAIREANLQAVSAVDASAAIDTTYSVITRETSKEIVVDAIVDSLGDALDIQPALSFKLENGSAEGTVPYLPITTDNPKDLKIPLSETEASRVDLNGWEGGVAMVLNDIKPPQAVGVMQQRLRDMRLQPGFEQFGWRQSTVFGLSPAEGSSDLYSRMMVVVIDENYDLHDAEGTISDAWVRQLAEPEVRLLQTALQRQTSLRQITQFDQQVSGEAQVKAYVALTLSWMLIIIYLWFRFGNIAWGLAAVVALIHDVLVAVGAVAVTYYIAGTWFGSALGIHQSFRIDLSMVAALLTVVGYSVHDTIIVFDRIRENRGRSIEITPENINNSINQTLSRTLLTSLTAWMTLIIMYFFGGPSIHGFNYVMIIGIATGTYSSIGVASQFLLFRRKTAYA